VKITKKPVRAVSAAGLKSRGEKDWAGQDERQLLTAPPLVHRLASAGRALFWEARGRPCRYQPAPHQGEDARASFPIRLRGVLSARVGAAVPPGPAQDGRKVA
jgi:hypothetical protein